MQRNNVLKILSDIAQQERTEEELAELVQQLAKTLPSSFIAEEEKNILAEQAREFTPKGYRAYYKLLYGFDPPKHVIEKEVTPIIDSVIGTIVFAWRGSWKTISISVTFLSWFIGLFPHKSNLVICASDDNSKKITSGVADIIRYHPEFKRAFPNVVPDDARWSMDGFFVIDKSMSRDEWSKKQAASIDPTFVGGGYDSQRINGKHPTGMLICDDLHNEKNSASEKLRQEVIEVVLKVILKTAVKDKDKLVTKIVFIGTPWDSDDVNYVLKETGEFNFINIPAATRAVEGEGVYCDGTNREGVVYDDIVGWWNFTWLDGYGVQSFVSDRATLGIKSFWQMIMLDLTTASSKKLRYYTFPFEEVRYDLPTMGGADPTSFTPTVSGKGSYFALAYIAQLPTGGLLVVDGVLEQCTMLAAENHILYAQDRFTDWIGTAVEDVGVGKIFIQSCYRNPRLKVFKSGLKNLTDATVNNKYDRVLGMHKDFENMTVRISGADTPFLNATRRLFDKFWDLDKTDYAFDAGDSIFHALKNMSESLIKAERGEKKKKFSPLAGLNTFSGIRS